MTPPISIHTEFDPGTPTADLSWRYVDAPLHQVGFAVTDAEITKLAETYPDRIFRTRRTGSDKGLEWDFLTLRFSEDVFVQVYGDYRKWVEIWAPDAARAAALHTEIAELLARHRPAQQPCFFALRFEGGDFQTERVENVPDDPGDEFLRLCYGADIHAWLAQFAERTAARPGGLTILEGPPGTGKTSLVSLLVRRLEHTHSFYILPTSQSEALSKPELVPFWTTQNQRHPDRIKVIVIEDAERLLLPRRSNSTDETSAVLNIADGLVGRMLKLHLLCSVNARMSELDSAILRPGRLMNQRSFGLLSGAEAQALARFKGLPLPNTASSRGYTMAEVLNPDAMPVAPRPPMGFAPG